MLLMLICVSITVCAQTEKGIEILRRAEAGDANAQFELSGCFEDGREDFPESKRDYVKWLKRAAENGPSSHYHETCPSCKGEGKW